MISKTFYFLFLLTSFFSFTTPATAKEVFSLQGKIGVLENKKYFLTLMKKINEAKKEIRVCMYVFKTTSSPGNLAGKVIKELTAAAKRGIHVEVLLEKNDRPKDFLNKNNRYTADILKKAGIKVRFDQKKINTHSKLVIIDRKLVFIGSHNLTHTALSRSNETSLMVESKELAEYFLKYIRNIN